MNNTNLLYTSFLYLFTITIMLIVSIITTFKRKPANQTAGKLLVLLNWCFFYGALVGYLNSSGKIVYAPHLFRTAHIAMLLYMPLSYLYVYQFFSPRKLSYRDLLHLLPLLVYLIDYFPFFIKSGTEKMTIFHSLDPTQTHVSFNEGLFMPANFHVILRYVLMSGYWVAQVLVIKKILSVDSGGIKQNNPTKVKWIKWLTASEVLICFPPLIALAMGSLISARILLQVCGLLAASVQAYFLFSHPGILYAIKGTVVIKKDSGDIIPPLAVSSPVRKEIAPNDETAKQPVQYLSESMLDKIQLSLDSYMHSAKPYLQPAYGLIDLARETHFTPHQISAFINKRCEMNFYSYINKYRIDFCKQKIVSKEYIDKTLEAISQESGFQSRATFIRAFKSNTGLTPSEYIKHVKSTST